MSAGYDGRPFFSQQQGTVRVKVRRGKADGATRLQYAEDFRKGGTWIGQVFHNLDQDAGVAVVGWEIGLRQYPYRMNPQAEILTSPLCRVWGGFDSANVPSVQARKVHEVPHRASDVQQPARRDIRVQ